MKKKTRTCKIFKIPFISIMKSDTKLGCLLKNRTKLCQIITLFVKNDYYKQLLYNKLKNDTVLFKNYDDIFVEQGEAGIIEAVESTSTLGDCHYIAHHLVFREDKKTSKLRIVFDASAKENRPSLNKVL